MTRGGHVPQSRVVLLAERSALHEHAPIGSDDPDVRGAMLVAVTMDLRFALLRAGGKTIGGKNVDQLGHRSSSRAIASLISLAMS